MKRLLILAAFALIFTACNDSGSSSSDTTFRIESGDLTKFASPAPGTATTCNIGGTLRGNYAIIYNGTIGSTSYVGIACSDNPLLPENPTQTEGYNLKIYFAASSISSGTYSATIKQNSSTYSETLTLTISLNSTYSTSNYNVYDINGTSSNIGSIDIRAVQY